MPSSELVYESRVAEIVDSGEALAEPALEEQQMLVDDRKHAMVHEQLAKEGGGTPVRQTAERLVREWDLPFCQALEQLRNLRVPQPDQTSPRPGHGPQSLEQGHQFQADAPEAIVQEFGELLGEKAARAQAPAVAAPLRIAMATEEVARDTDTLGAQPPASGVEAGDHPLDAADGAAAEGIERARVAAPA